LKVLGLLLSGLFLSLDRGKPTREGASGATGYAVSFLDVRLYKAMVVC